MGLLAGALLAVIVVQAVWLWPVLVGDSALFTRDVLGFRLPYHVIFGEQLRAGHLPTWTDRLSGGMPLWHHPSAELADPSSVLFAVLPPHQAYGAQMFVHMVLATVGVALLARSLRVHPLLSAWAGLLYVACGAVASCWTVKFIPTSSLPWVVLAARWCAKPLAHRAPAVLALPVAFMLLHPDPPAVVGAVALATVVALACAPRERRGQTLTRLALGGVLGVLLAAPFLVPASRIVAHSARGDVVHGAEANLSPYILLESLAPGVLGLAGASGPGAGLTPIRDDGPRMVGHVFMGVTTILLLLLGGRRRMRLHVALGAAAAGLAVLALGEHVPLTGWLWKLSQSRFPDKLMLPASLALLLLAARRGTVVLRRTAVPMGRGVAIMAAGSALILASPVVATWIASPLHPESQPDTEVMALTALMRSGAVALLGALVFLLVLRSKNRRVHWLGAFLAVAAVDALGGLSTLTLMAPTERLERAVALTLVPPWHGQALFSGDTKDPGPAVGQVFAPNVPDDESSVMALGLGSPDTGVLLGARYPVGIDFSRLEPVRMHNFVEKVLPRLPLDLATRVLGRMGVERLILRVERERLGPVPGKVLGVSFLGKSWVHIRPDEVASRVSVQTRWSNAAGAKAQVLALADPSRPPVVADASVPAPDGVPDDGATLRIVQDAPTRLVAEVRSTSNALMVVRESMDDAWHALVDGEEVPVRTVNLCQRAVLVPPGTHRVEMVYRTPGVLTGLALGAFGLLGTVMVARRRKRSGTH